MVVFYWSLSDNKFPQVSTILLGILSDLSNAVVWIVSTRPIISKSSSLFGECTKSTNYNTLHFHIPQIFQFPFYPSHRFLSNLLCGQLRQQSPQFDKFSLFVNYYKVQSSDRN